MLCSSARLGAATVSLGTALDAPTLTWTTDGSALWIGQDLVSHDGVDAAISGAITNNQQSGLQTIVPGPGTVSFWWKVSSETNYDFLRFNIGELEQANISGEVNWQRKTFSVPLGSQTLRWSYTKDNSLSAGLDAGGVDQVTYSAPPYITNQPTNLTVFIGGTATFTVGAAGFSPFTYQWQHSTNTLPGATNASLTLTNVQLSDTGDYRVAITNVSGGTNSATATLTVIPVPLDQALDSTGFSWTTNGNAGWFGQVAITHDAIDAAQSGSITNSQSSGLQATVIGPGTLTYWWKVSSETNYDYLRLYIGGVEQVKISGEVDWQQKTVSIPAGTQALLWQYSKDDSLSAGRDAGWVDQVSFTPAPPTASFTSYESAFCNTSAPFNANSSAPGTVAYPIVSYQWNFGDGGTATGVTANHTYHSFGTFSVRLTVTDNYEPPRSAYATNSIVIYGTNPPVAMPGGPYVLDLGSNLVLNGSASTDPEIGCGDAIISYVWDLNNDGNFSDVTGVQPTVSFSQLQSLFNAAGVTNLVASPTNGLPSFPVRLRVTDTMGLSHTGLTQLTIYDNRPFARFTNNAATVTNCGQAVFFDARVSTHGRPDKQIVSYLWNFGDSVTTTNTTYNHSYATMGTYQVTLTVTDNNVPPRSSSMTNLVSIVAANPPVAQPGGPYVMDLSSNLVLNGSASSDPDSACGDSIVSYAWDLNNDGTFSDATGAQPTVLFSQLQFLLNSVGITNLAASPTNGLPNFSVRLRVTDTYGLSRTGATQLTIYDNRPVARFTNSPASPVGCGQPFFFDGRVSSHGRPDRQIVSYFWDFGDSVTSTNATNTHLYASLGTYRVALTVTDNNVPPRTSSVTNLVSVQAWNGPSSQPGGPYVLDVSSNLVLDGSASTDPDIACGDSIVSYAWDVNGDGNFTDANISKPTLTYAQVQTLLNAVGISNFIASPVTGQPALPISLRVTDTTARTHTALTTLRIYDNRPFASFTITPPAIMFGQSAAFDASASSHGRPDRAVVSYAWNFGEGGSASGVTASHLFTNAGNYPITLVVTDDNVPARTATNVIMLEVGGPPSFTTQPTNRLLVLGGSTTFSATVAGSAPFTYQWRFNDTNLTDATNLTLTLTNLQATNAGGYSLVVTNSYGAVTSSVARLGLVPVVAWGNNDGKQTNVNFPELLDAAFISAGGGHNLAVRRDGTVFGWGATNYDACKIPPEATNVVAVSAGVGFSMVLRADGTVLAWGSSTYGETNLPPGLTNVVAISAGWNLALALKQDGRVVAWGHGDVGQTNVPTGLSNVVAIAAAWMHGLALKSDGLITTWGHDAYALSYPPAGATNVVAIAARAWNGQALRADGAVLAWGNNSYNENFVPASATNGAGIGCGNLHNAAIRRDGRVFAWGANFDKQTNVPPNIMNAVQLSVGSSHNVVLFGSQAPFITMPLLGASVQSGASFTFRTTAVGSQPLFYQWQRYGTNVPGETNATLTLGNAQPTVAGPYRVVVSNAFGIVSSPEATLDVSGPPVITTQPADQTTYPGGTVSFAAAALGATPLSWQWFHNASPIADATNNSLTLSRVLPRDAGFYSVQVSNTYGAMLSSNAEVKFISVVGWGFDGSGQATAPGGLSNVVSVAAGGFHSAALRRDGTVVTWGWNSAHQTNVPPDLTNVMSLSASGDHSLALRRDGTVVAWGSNTYGETNIPPDVTNVLAASAGGYHNLALRPDGTVRAWGRSDYGQINVPANLSRVVAVAAGLFHSVALRDDGTVVAWGRTFQAFPPLGLGGVVAISAGNYHSLALKSDGTVVAWGENQSGELNVPAGLSNVVAVAAGNGHSVALLNNRTVISWGTNGWHSASPPTGLTNVVAIAEGGTHSLALADDVPAFLTGQPLSGTGQIGGVFGLHVNVIGSLPLRCQWLFNGTNLAGATNLWLTVTNLTLTNRGTFSVIVSNMFGSVTSAAVALTLPPSITAQPQDRLAWVGRSASFTGTATGTLPMQYQWRFNGVDVPGATGSTLNLTNLRYQNVGAYSVVVSNLDGVAVSSNATLSVTRVVAWGAGAGSLSNEPPTLTNIVAIAGAGWPCTALLRDGSVWGGYGAVTLSNIVAIAGWNASLALQEDGRVAAWSIGFSGETNVPSDLTNAVAISAGLNHNLALRADGTVTGWGNNNDHQLDVPGGLNDAVSVAAGGQHSLALRKNGTVVGWGFDNRGQASPPSDLTNAIAIAAGNVFSMALCRDGTVRAWGVNSTGETTVPAGLSNVVAIAAGQSHSLALRANGTVVSWGYTPGYTNMPAGLSNVVAIACGGYYCLALLDDGVPAPELRLADPAVVDGKLRVSVPTARGQTYFLECKDSLPAIDWLMTPPAGGNEGTRILTAPTPGSSKRFYRARQQGQ